MHLFLVASYPPHARARKKVLVDSFVTILIKFLLLLVVRHLFLIANLVTTSKALVTTSNALVPSSFLPPPGARAREKVLVDSFAIVENFQLKSYCYY